MLILKENQHQTQVGQSRLHRHFFFNSTLASTFSSPLLDCFCLQLPDCLQAAIPSSLLAAACFGPKF